MTDHRGAHERPDNASGTDEYRRRRDRRDLSEREKSRWGLRNAMGVIVAVGGLTALSIVGVSGISHVTSNRSHQKIATQQLIDSLYSCLEGEVRQLVPAGTEVWIDPNESGVSAGPELPLIANPLRVVAATGATLAPARHGHMTLVLVRTGGADTCLGLQMEKSPTPSSSRTALH